MTDRLAQSMTHFEVAFDEVLQLHTYRLIWKNLIAMLQSRPELPHNILVNNWLITSYTRTLAVGIRRQSEDSGARGTIGSVLRRVKEDAHSFTRESCNFPEVDPNEPARDSWVGQYADTTTEPLDPRRVETVEQELRTAPTGRAQMGE